MIKVASHEYKLIKSHPIFKSLSEEEFDESLSKCGLRSYAKSELVLDAKTFRNGLLLLIEGTIEVYASGTSSTQSEVLEVLQSGEIIDLPLIVHFFEKQDENLDEIRVTYGASIRAIDRCQCLHIPFSVFRDLSTVKGVKSYLIHQLSCRLEAIYAYFSEQVQLASDWIETEPFVRKVQDFMTSPALTVKASDHIQVVAETIINNTVSSVVVIKDDKPVGIITQSDLVKIIAKEQPATKTAEDHMTAEPFTITSDAYYYEALAKFLTKKIKHLPVIDDDKVVGMVTLSDLLRKKNRGALQTLQAIEDSTEENIHEIKQAIYFVLANLLQDELPVVHMLKIITKLYDRLVIHCLELALKDLPSPPVVFNWFQMGSAGRGEQFILNDQDHFLIYAAIEHLPKKEQQQIHEYFKIFTHRAATILEKAGLEKCKGKMMASEKEWRGSLETWENRLRQWMLHSTTQNVMLANSFFGFRYLYGDKQLYEGFLKKIQEQLEKSSIFLYHLAVQEKEHPIPTFNLPIRSLFRLEPVELDLKKDVFFPFHHALQVLSLHHGIYEGTAIEKINALLEKKLITEKLADDLLFAYSVLLHIRVTYGWKKYKSKSENVSHIALNQLTLREKDDLLKTLKLTRSFQSHVLAVFDL